MNHTNIKRPYASTNGQWIARNIISGFFTAPVEALPEISVTDVVSLLSVLIKPTELTYNSTSPTNEEHTWAYTPSS